MSKPLVTAAALAGMSLGSLSPLVTPPAEDVQPVERRVITLEEPHHKADRSVRDALNMPEATNAELIEYVKNLEVTLRKAGDALKTCKR